MQLCMDLQARIFILKKFKDILILHNQRNHFGFVMSVLKTRTKLINIYIKY